VQFVNFVGDDLTVRTQRFGRAVCEKVAGFAERARCDRPRHGTTSTEERRIAKRKMAIEK
jgi:hypothetical protein